MTERKYIDFLRGVKHPKISWVLDQLEQAGIPCRIQGESLTGPVLQIATGHAELALEIINKQIGEFNVGLSNRTITIADLPDNHEFFQPEHKIPVPTTPTILDRAEVNDSLAVIDVEATVKDETKPKPKEIGVDPVASRHEKWAGAVTEGEMQPPLGDTEPKDELDWLDWEADEDDEEPDPVELTPRQRLENWVTVAKRLLRHRDTMVHVSPAGNMLITIFEVNSTNLSTIGAVMSPTDVGEELVFYIGFKGNTIEYRYRPVDPMVMESMFAEAVGRMTDPTQFSVGKKFHKHLRNPADEGKILCERYAGKGEWLAVHPKKKK